MIRIWESFIRVLQLPETGRRGTTRGQSPSPRMLCTKMHPHRQDGAETLPEAPAVLPGNIPAGLGWGDMEKHLLLVLTRTPPRSSVSSLLRLRSGTADVCWTWEGFECGWLKFNPSPAALCRGPCQPPQ